MKIGLIDVDSHNFPNLCLMKLSAYHKAKGHTVEWWNAKGRYDLVYKSRVFTDTYSKDTITVTNAEQVIFGGTGYDTKNRLPPEVEHSYARYCQGTKLNTQDTLKSISKEIGFFYFDLKSELSRQRLKFKSKDGN